MSDIHGLINHQPGYYYITLEEDYVTLFEASALKRNAKTEEENKARFVHAVAKAYICSVAEQLSNAQFKATGSEQELWFFLSFSELERRLHGAYKERTLKDAMKELVEDGYFFKRPNRNPSYRTMEYRINLKKIRSELSALPAKSDDGDSAKLHDGQEQEHRAKLHDDSAKLHDDSAKLHARINTEGKYRRNRITSGAPDGEVPSASQKTSSQRKGSKENSKTEKPSKKHNLTLQQQAVLNEWDTQNGIPCDRTDYNTCAMAAYTAALIAQQHMRLEDMARLIAMMEALDYIKKQGLTPALFKQQLPAQLKLLKKQPTQASTASQQEQPRTHDSYGNAASAGKSPLDFILNNAQASMAASQ